MHLPPVYSPLGLGAIIHAVGGGAFGARKARPALVQYLSETFDAPTVVPTGSGTQALQLALQLAPPFGKEASVVALPAYSCFDLVTAAVGAQVRVRFYDVDPNTLSPVMDHLRMVIADGVSAVVAANLYGYPLDWAAIRAECAANGVFLIEDAAQGMGTGGSEAGGGCFGDVSVLSFGRGKGWTGGGGGALLVRDAGAVERAEGRLTEPNAGFGLRGAAVTTAAWTLGRPSLYGIPASIPQLGLGETVYKEPKAPHDISTFSAALARATAQSASAAVPARRSVACRWSRALDADAFRTAAAPCNPIGGPEEASFLRYAVILDSAVNAESLVGSARRMGVARGYPTALDQLPQAELVRIDASTAELPGARRMATTLVTLPTHQWVSGRRIEEVVRLLERTGCAGGGSD